MFIRDQHRIRVLLNTHAGEVSLQAFDSSLISSGKLIDHLNQVTLKLLADSCDHFLSFLNAFDLSIGDFFEEGSRAQSVFDKLRTLSPAAQKEVESFIKFKRAQEFDEPDGGEGEGGDV